MLFINRRGVAGFVSCRSCGHVVKCPHCDVSLSQHNNGKMVCHYCGYEEPTPTVCPSCGSKYISGFKAGTQKIEEIVKMRFPTARVLRMDFDTTRTKEGHEKILSAFANEEADSYWRNDNRKYTMEDISDDTVAYRYHIQEATLENPYENFDDYGYLGTIEKKQYDNHFIIDNDSNGRYDWDIIEEILAKYNIPWQSGYCD